MDAKASVKRLREAYLTEVVQAIAAFMEIEEFILDLEDLDSFVRDGIYHTRARAFRERLNTLRLRINSSHYHTHKIIDMTVKNSHLVSLGVILFRNQLKQLGIDDRTIRTAAQAAILNPISIRASRRSQSRRERRAILRTEREALQTQAIRGSETKEETTKDSD